MRRVLLAVRNDFKDIDLLLEPHGGLADHCNKNLVLGFCIVLFTLLAISALVVTLSVVGGFLFDPWGIGWSLAVLGA